MKWSKEQKSKQECPSEWDPTETVYKAILPKSEVEKAFKALSDELVAAAGRGYLSDGKCAVYLAYSTLVDGLYKSLKESLRCMED